MDPRGKSQLALELDPRNYLVLSRASEKALVLALAELLLTVARAECVAVPSTGGGDECETDD